MALVCLPKHVVENLKKSALSGEVEIAKLYEMSSKERRDFFTKHTDEELGKFINTEFEKAMVSQQKDALVKWAQMVFKPESKNAPVYKTVLDKINNLNEIGVLNPKTEKAFLEDLVSDKLGVKVTAEEVKLISVYAKKIDAAQKKLGHNLGSPSAYEDNLEFFKAKKEMDDYLNSHNPAPQLKVLTGTIGRGMMLASVKSPLLNIGSNLELGITEGLTRRIASGQIHGTDNKMARDYIKMVNKVYQKTGYDLSRMTSLADSGASGERVLGDVVHSQGKGAVRKLGRVVEDTVFKQLMGAPDVVFGATHFADSVNLGAFKIANGNKAKAQSIMKDAMRIKPQTIDGEVLRAQALLDAQTATWTNKTWASEVSMGIRKIFNKLSGNLRIGDYLFPFVKTPANVVATGLDYAGLGIPKAAFKMVQAMKRGELKDKEFIQSVSRDLVRSGLGITGAMMIVSNINEDDFVGAYDPTRAQYEELRNSNTNSVRIGSKWISLDWFGPLSVPMTAQLYAKKYGGKDLKEQAWQYGKGLTSTATNIPGVKDVADYAKKSTYKKDQNSSDAAAEAQDYATSQLYSRLVPSFISDIAKATDDKERKTGKGIEGIKSKIPIVRQTVPIKKNIFGEDLKAESGLSTILFGSRVNTDKDTRLTKELGRVGKANGVSVNFTDWSKSSSQSLVQLREKLGKEAFDKATVSYGKNIKERLDRITSMQSYHKLTDEEKLKVINNADSASMKKTFKQYDFKPVRNKSDRSLTKNFD